MGTVRITTGKHAGDTLLWPMLPSFMRRHPGIEVEVCVEDGTTDLVAGRHDAGIRLRERLEKDMIALAVGRPLSIAVVAAPGHLNGHPAPTEPADLMAHRCIAYRDAQGDLSPWSFERDGRSVTIIPARGPVSNDADLCGRRCRGLRHSLHPGGFGDGADWRRPSYPPTGAVRWLSPLSPDRRGTTAFELFKKELRASKTA